MTSRRDRLDGYVRLTSPLDEGQVAAYVDQHAKRALLEEIVSMPTEGPSTAVPPSTSPIATARRGPRRTVLAAGLAGLVALGALTAAATAGLLGSGARTPPPSAAPAQSPPPTSAADPTGDVFGGEMMCVEVYGPQTLANRGFAIDGTVVAIGEAPADPEADPYVDVTFAVNRWFRGGEGEQVMVGMFPPDVTTSVGNTSYEVGSRLLVSGEDRDGGTVVDDPLAWPCGFTRWYDAGEAATWAQAFG